MHDAHTHTHTTSAWSSVSNTTTVRACVTVRSDSLPLSLTHSTGVKPLGTKGPWVFAAELTQRERERGRENESKGRKLETLQRVAPPIISAGG